MPDLRKDPIVGRWVIVAQSRAQRPHDLAPAEPLRSQGDCPFCAGQESETPEAVLIYPASHNPPVAAPGHAAPWRVRVVPNKYPALETAGHLEPPSEGLYVALPGVGAHEVIIESPEHLRSTTDLPTAQVADVLWAYRDRLLDLKQDRRLVYGMLFKNVGAAAGASLEHTHSQLIVTPIVPINVQEEMAGSLAFYQQQGRCIFCEIVSRELVAGQRIVLDSAHFTAFCPYASRFPYETWILPKRHASHYEELSESLAADLALVLRQVIGKIEAALDRPAYNYIVHTAPLDQAPLAHYHWHVEVIPRITKVAGFEWGTGFYINAVPPEAAAERLRPVQISE